MQRKGLNANVEEFFRLIIKFRKKHGVGVVTVINNNSTVKASLMKSIPGSPGCTVDKLLIKKGLVTLMTNKPNSSTPRLLIKDKNKSV